MEPLGSYIRQWPRTAAAIVFGGATMAATHFAWLPDARMSGMAPALTIAAGCAHALAAAITGRRLLDGTRTRTSLDAGLLGAATSLLAVAMFAPAFTFFLSRDARPSSPLSYLLHGRIFISGSWMGLARGISGRGVGPPSNRRHPG